MVRGFVGLGVVSVGFAGKCGRRASISQGNEPLANTPGEFAKVVKSDADKWGAIGKKLGVKLD